MVVVDMAVSNQKGDRDFYSTFVVQKFFSIALLAPLKLAQGSLNEQAKQEPGLFVISQNDKAL